MFLNRVNVKIALTFTLFSTMLSVIIFSALSLLITRYIKNEDIKQLAYQLDEIEAKYHTGGLNLVTADIDISNMHHEGKPYFIRLKKDIYFFHMGPTYWKNSFDYKLLNDAGNGEIITLYSDKFEFDLDVLTYKTPDGTIFQIGISDQHRRQFTNALKKVFITLIIPLFFTSLFFGFWYAKRTLQPVVDLTKTIDGIIKTGKMEKKLKVGESDDELSELTRLFTTLFEKNENLIIGMKETLDNVSHDLRTPLTRIRGISEVALTSGDHIAQQEALSDGIEEIDSIIKILNALLDITASENGVLKLECNSFNFRELIERSIELYSFIAEGKMINFVFKYNTDLTEYYGDQTRLRQVVSNLMDNAVKYSKLSGIITIAVDRDDQNLILKVTDDGIGISTDEINNIWNRLFRSTRSRKEPGLGLGLSMVKAIVVAHGGKVSVESIINIGSTFTITLPLQKSNLIETTT